MCLSAPPLPALQPPRKISSSRECFLALPVPFCKVQHFAEPKLALRSKVNVPGSSSLFSTSNKRLELAPQAPRTARPLGFQLGQAPVRNEEWARPELGDVSWKLQAAHSGLPALCASHSSTASTPAVSGGDSEPATHHLLSRPGPRKAARPSNHLVSSHDLAGPYCAPGSDEHRSSHFYDTGVTVPVW